MHKPTKMQKEALLSLLTLLTARVAAQSTSNTGVVTSYYSICPTATSTTITLPTTITYCPGPNCNGGGPAITSSPMGQGAGGVYITQTIVVDANGNANTMGIYQTVMDCMGPSGTVPATYTITEPCPCHETMPASVMPSGFETTVVPCHACAATGGPATVTLTQPCPTGPYASQTPVMAQSSAPNAASAASPSSGNGSGSGSESVAPAANSNTPASGMTQCPGGEMCPAGAGSPSSSMRTNGTTPAISPPIAIATGAASGRAAAMPVCMLGMAFLAALVL